MGEHAASVFRRAGLVVDWDGSPEKAIFEAMSLLTAAGPSVR